ncbi:MAG: DNA repair protein [Clostridia bacterium]|nr:DNA repair protein [Oscillospiraceae bacterium]MBQ3763268.1 DNA repair protein [Clostridia bacterium]
MTDKELKKLNRAQLLELLVDQSREIDRLQAALDAANEKLLQRDLRLAQCGSIAEASLAITDVFEKAQEAADLYLSAAKRYVARTVAEGKPLPSRLNEKRRQEGSDK